ncbi:MAG: hypothetical protein HC769_14460 [Cyanobacteria bacterium CRU_2_1]|nr:hypothetical protein [Cyanobacteria bacterium RU_5_0]NJR59926.1 hypothetical protein [Cyanobacteria bacterium CRU_2_1]
MGRLFSVSAIIFFATILLCWVLTSDDSVNPLTGVLLFMSGILAIGFWGMSVLESESRD